MIPIVLGAPVLMFILNYMVSFYERRVYKDKPDSAKGASKVYVLTSKDYHVLRSFIERVCILTLVSLILFHYFAQINIFEGVSSLLLFLVLSLFGLYIVLYIKHTAVEFNT
jgi:hypothetical protein